MGKALSRRKYQEVVKFLKVTIGNERVAHRVRMQAALRLADLLSEHDRANERSVLAVERASARQAEAEALKLRLQLAERGIRVPVAEAAETAETAGAANPEQSDWFTQLLAMPEDTSEREGHAQ